MAGTNEMKYTEMFVFLEIRLQSIMSIMIRFRIYLEMGYKQKTEFS